MLEFTRVLELLFEWKNCMD